jgi:photosystem II stability/assembly factor-like uncharacterized protein
MERRQLRVATRTDDQILLLAGTRDGLYRYTGSCDRVGWNALDPVLEGYEISHAILDPRDGTTVWAAVSGHGHTAVLRSPDRGDNWQMAGAPFEVDQVWHVEPGHAAHPRRVYAGVKPAALYQSDDFGETWQPVTSLNEHASRGEWWEGGAGLILHTIVTDPRDPDDLTVAISVGGVFHSPDGGKTWAPRNDGQETMSDFWSSESGTPVHYPGVHRCVHKIVRHPANPDTLFLQNHEGPYRTDNRGQLWQDLREGDRSWFGFAIGITRDASVYVVPQDDNIRFSGQLAVYRRRDTATSWDVLSNGLPQVENLTLYREGIATDNCDPGGVYFGTSDGALYGTSDGGEAWKKIAADLPPIRSVSCEHFPG